MAIANARAMKGYVSICAQCRRVRTAEDEWEGLEAWIASHSQAQFSHSLCPSCYRAALAAAGLPDDRGAEL